MGCTHYWTQLRNIKRSDWQTISEDLAAIVSHAINVEGVTLWDAHGERPSQPEFGADFIAFNGAGDDSHESFVINQKREKLFPSAPGGWSFCKTARKPYDIAVTACLCYLASVAETHTVSSDGNGRDWLRGLEMARQALPRYANQLDIPRDILENDRWCAPCQHIRATGYDFRFCVDGAAYITGPGGRSYRFYSHFEAAKWAATWTERRIYVESSWGGGYEGGQPGRLFNPTGAFNDKRNRALARQQRAALSQMLDRATGDRLAPPPAFVRPGDIVPLAESLAYTIADLLKLAEPA